jgi:hypothetical protein
MIDKPVSPLRQRMIDMTARRFKEKVQRDYVRHVRTFAALLGRSPDTATSEDLRRFQLHMAQQQISAGSINAAIAALRFLPAHDAAGRAGQAAAGSLCDAVAATARTVARLVAGALVESDFDHCDASGGVTALTKNFVPGPRDS